jgi:hypothetical protein
MIAKAYFDTCIVSGIAKEDLSPKEQQALLQILRLYKKGDLILKTSSIVKEEIDRIPEKVRGRHEIIYSLISDIPLSRAKWTDSGLTTVGAGGGSREDPLYSELKQLLPDNEDAHHVFQAIKSNLEYFVTTDYRTILRYEKKLKSRFGLRVVSPIQMLEIINK